MNAPHPIPYQGSKRKIAKHILAYFPPDIDVLIEPFAGSAAITIAAALAGKASHFHINDLNAPLMALWDAIIHSPLDLSQKYAHLWQEQQRNPRQYYDSVRNEFNRTHKPEHLLYLLARCVKASVRYNPKGEFNQSPDNRRLGRHPTRMSEDIRAVSGLLRGRVTITAQDYKKTLDWVGQKTLVYMDPPYQGVSGNSDHRYYQRIDFDEFMQFLAHLTSQEIPFILSYDGRTGTKTYGRELPLELQMRRIEVKAGPSTQATLLGRKAITYEALYLSKALVERLGAEIDTIVERQSRPSSRQLALFEV